MYMSTLQRSFQMEFLHNVLMFYWDNRFTIIAIIIAFIIGYGIENSEFDFFEE